MVIARFTSNSLGRPINGDLQQASVRDPRLPYAWMTNTRGEPEQENMDSLYRRCYEEPTIEGIPFLEDNLAEHIAFRDRCREMSIAEVSSLFRGKKSRERFHVLHRLWSLGAFESFTTPSVVVEKFRYDVSVL